MMWIVLILAFAGFTYLAMRRVRNVSINLRMHQSFPGQLYYDLRQLRAKNPETIGTRGYAKKKIGYQHKGGFAFRVVRERWCHKILKGLGLASEARGDNPAFDRKFYFITDYPEAMSQALRSPIFRDNLRALFEHSAKELYCTDEIIWFIPRYWQNYKPEMFFEPCWAQLRDLTQALTKPDPAQPYKERTFLADLFSSMGIVLFLSTIVASIFILDDQFATIEAGKLWGHAWWFAIYGMGAWVVAMAVVFYRTSWLPWVLRKACFFGFIGLIVFGVLLIREVNYRFDDAPPTTYTEPYVSKECELKCGSGRHGSTYSLSPQQCQVGERQKALENYKRDKYRCRQSAEFRFKMSVVHWNQKVDKLYTTDVPVHIFDMAAPGDTITIPVHPGALGIEWVDERTRVYTKP